MARFAALADLTLVRVRCRMAGTAIARQGNIELSDVTRVAGEVIVVRRQLEAGFQHMIEITRAPVEYVVAAAAVRPETSLVSINIAMARDTGPAVRGTRVSAPMAGLAPQSPVTTCERESGNGTVIEGDTGPRRRAMTVGAFGPVLALVNVAGSMTVHARSSYCGERFGPMTGSAGFFRMPACQCESGSRVIERCRLPGLRAVAGCAVFAEIAVVHVVVAMTRNTLRIRLPVRVARFMAGRTRYGSMTAAERKIRTSVIERTLFEATDIRFPAFVLGVAARTFRRLWFRQSTVKAGFLRNIGANLGMTVKAQPGLGVLRQRRVTRGTLPFDILMAAYDGPGHYQPLLNRGREHDIRVQGQREERADCNKIPVRNSGLHQ